MDRNVYLRMSEYDAEHWWFVARRQILRDQIALLQLPTNARILEVGAGGNLAMLSEFGLREASELDDEARRIASERSGIDIRRGALPNDISYKPGPFDLIVALDVIEHIEADRESDQASANLLLPRARLLINVPAYGWLWPEHDNRHDYKTRYTWPAVRKLAEDAGLEIEKFCYFNILLFPLIVGIRTLKKISDLDDRPDNRLPGPDMTAFLRRIFICEHNVLRHFTPPFGVSNLCIARRG